MYKMINLAGDICTYAANCTNLCNGYYLQITNLKAFKIPPALFYTFLKIEINH